MINGNDDQYVAGWSPELQKNELNDPGSRERLDKDQKEKGTLLKGIQVVAWEAAEDRVELKVKLDTGGLGPEFFIQPMLRVGSNDWKQGEAGIYDETWDQDGQAQPLGQ